MIMLWDAERQRGREAENRRDRNFTHDRRALSLQLCLSATLLLLLPLSAGCGYTFRGNLPARLRTVYVQPFTNRIDITSEPTNLNQYKIYRPRLELDLTDKVIDRFQFDGSLRPAGPDQADTMLVGELAEFRREPLRFARTGNVEEFRLSLVVNAEFRDLQQHTVIWQEQIVGDATFFEQGALAESEVTALDRAMDDVARRIVERIVEDW